jgi:hypothetical protein
MNTSNIAKIAELKIKIHPDLDDVYHEYGDNPHSGWAKERCMAACVDVELAEDDLMWANELHELLLKAYAGSKVARDMVDVVLGNY